MAKRSDIAAVTAREAGKGDSAPEGFQPVAVESPIAHPMRFRLRCLLDLQLATIVEHLRPALGDLHGAVLDVGAGESPWRAWLPPDTHYTGLDVGHAADFGMDSRRSDIVYYDGRTMPLADDRFDAVLCIEVLEHATDPSLLLDEIFRVMKTNSTLLLTVPWSARRHHIPHDYHRFTREQLGIMLRAAGFSNVDVRERGNDICAIANKLIVLTIRLTRPRSPWRAILALPAAAFCGLLATGFAVCAHLSVALGKGSRDDPLGYFVRARKGAGARSLS